MEAYLGAAAIAALVSAIELVTRYRDDAWRALASLPSITYIVINGAIGALAAIWLLSFYPNAFKASGTTVVDLRLVAIAAGLGSLAAFRAGIMKVRLGPNEISVGPGLILEALLAVVDRGVDRRMASYRGAVADELSGSFDFDTNGGKLVSECLALLSNLNAQDGQQLRDFLSALKGRNDIDPKQKGRLLILTLLTTVGKPVLEQAVASVNK